MRKVLLIPLLVVLAGAAYATALFCLITRQAGRDEARAADAIIVFGAAEYNGRPSPVLRARLDHALRLYRQRLAPWLITTGGAGGDWRYTEAGVGRDYFLARGVSAAALLVEPHGYSTVDSVARVSAMLRAHRLRRIIVVSDGYHLYRIKRLFAARGFLAWGSPWPGEKRYGWAYDWSVCRQVVAYMLGQGGFRV